MGLGIHWYETKDWLHCLMDFYYRDEPITLPEHEYSMFNHKILTRLRTVRRLYTHRAFVPSSTLSFLHFVWVNLAKEQQAGIRVNDELGDIAWFEEQFVQIPAIMEQVTNPLNRHQLSSPNWAHYIRDIPRDRVVFINGEELVEIFREYGERYPELCKGKDNATV